MKKCNLITEISLEDFLKLGLVGYEHRKHFFNEKGKEIDYEKSGEWIKDSQGLDHWVTYRGIFSKIIWDKVDLNKVVLDNVEFSKKEGFKNHCICLALHTEPSEEEIEELTKQFNYVRSYASGGDLTCYSREEAYEKLLLDYSYLDKFLTWNGHQTYLLRCDVEHLYSEKRKFCTHDDYFDVPKSETKAVYLIRY